MKHLLSLFALAFSVSALAQTELKTQYIDCNDEDVLAWDKVIVSLKSETEYKEGTLFLSSNVEDSRANSGVMKLSQATATAPYTAENSVATFEVTLPSEIIGKFSTFFRASISMKRKDGTANAPRGLLCFSRIYDR